MQIKFLLSCLAFLIASNFIFAQTKAKFGKISQDELKMEKYDKDPEADAVILQSSCRMFYESFGNKEFMTYETQYRYKIFNKKSADIADFALPYLTDGESVKIKGASYNLVNGKIVESKLEEKNIFTEELTDNFSQKKFTMPEVREGTVFEFTYTYRSKSWYYPQTWYFQESIPVLYSELILEEPDFLSYKTIFLGFEKLTYEDKSRFRDTFTFQYLTNPSAGDGDAPKREMQTMEVECARYLWRATHLSAIRREPYMTSIRDYCSKMDFLLAYTKFGVAAKPFNNTWNDLNARYLEDKAFGGRLNETENLGFYSSKVKDIKEPVEKLEAIRKMVNSTVKFNGKYNEFAGRELKKVLATKEGSIGEVNLLLCAIAKKSGLEVYPALLSTRSRGKLNEQLPQSDLINYVICVMKTDKGLIYADAVDADTPVGFLPIECFNEKAWLVNDKGGEWLPINAGKSNETIMYNLDIKSNGESSIEAKFGFSGYAAIDFNSDKDANAKSIKEKAEKSLGDGKIEIVKDLLISPTATGLQTEITLKTKEEMEDIIYIPVLEALGYKKNPFEVENRKFPVDMPYLINETIIANITIPDGYTFDEIPPFSILALGNNDGKFTYMSSLNGNTLQLMSKIVLNKSYFAPEEYEFLRKFFGEVVKKHAEQVVLKKK